MYPAGEYDLAGFAVGVVEKSAIDRRPRHRAGRRRCIGLASSGPHSNGFSLIRRIVDVQRRRPRGADAAASTPRRTLGDALLAPTRIYVKPVLALDARSRRQGHGAHHRRRPPRERAADVARRTRGARSSARVAAPARSSTGCSEQGNVADAEMHRVFNCGIGMVVVVARRPTRERAIALLAARASAPTASARVVPRAPAAPRRRSSPDGAARRATSRMATSRASPSSSRAAARTSARCSTRERARRRSPARSRGDQQPRRRARARASPRRTASRPRVVDHRAFADRATPSTPRSPRRSTRASPTSSCSPASCACSARRSCAATPAACSTSIRRCCPPYPGLHTHRRALADGVRMHGCTVHFVTADVDDGPIVAQARRAGARRTTTRRALAARVLAAEHRLLPRVGARGSAQGRLRHRRRPRAR